MLTFVFVIVVSVAVVGSMWMLRNMQPQGDSAESSLFPIRDSMRSDSDERDDSDFHAVAIRPCNDACAAVKALDGKRFLSHNPPFLPLADCDYSMCQCRYEHFSDRRESQDRRDELVGARSLSMDREGMDRRLASDRRGSQTAS